MLYKQECCDTEYQHSCAGAVQVQVQVYYECIAFIIFLEMHLYIG